MKCNEARLLLNPYLDSELDARATIEVDAHLVACADCARLFADGRVMEAGVKTALKQGPRTVALWEEIERSVRTAGAGGPAPLPRPHSSQVGVLTVLAAQLRAGWRRSRWAWGALAAAWGAILGLTLSAQEPEPGLLAGAAVPSASEMRLAWQQKQLLMADLAFATERAAAEKPKAPAPAPRSQRPNKALNV